MLYVIKNTYVGPNHYQDNYVDCDTIVISSTPTMTNLSREIRIDGWCGTTNDWSVSAHGEYPTIELARAAIQQHFGNVRDSDPNGDRFVSDDEDVVETYKPGQYAPMSGEATADWAYPGIQSDIQADTSDERIAELVAQYEAEANSSGYTLDSDLDDFMKNAVKIARFTGKRGVIPNTPTIFLGVLLNPALHSPPT